MARTYWLLQRKAEFPRRREPFELRIFKPKAYVWIEERTVEAWPRKFTTSHQLNPASAAIYLLARGDISYQ
jgi:hypothetical protein